ncbi:MAG: lipopolysaccharide biosynthesis regulator YciM [Gammaproteobacteria bacterium]|jgi:lipopolysaccharide biosynthesis regulator YciM
MDLWLFLLVFISIFTGWVLGRWRPFKKTQSTNQLQNYSDSYAQGLNYLLLDDPDSAIKVFTNIVEVNPNTIEVHLSLGNLFRSKGEVDRAIKVHQSLLARADLSQKQRSTAIEELASDYLKAGLLGRAEKLFKELINLNSTNLFAYSHLLDLYITQKSWGEAVDCAQVLFDLKHAGASVALSQCLCEAAEKAVSKGNQKKARNSLLKALEVDSSCVRATLLLIRWHLNRQDHPAAKKIFQRLIIKKPEYMALYIEPAKQLFQQGNESTQYQTFLQQQYLSSPSTRLAIALLEHYVKTKQSEKAKKFLTVVLSKTPSFGAYNFALQFLRVDSMALTDTWEGLSNFLKAMQEKKTEFVCTQCGYGSHAIQWHCPSCRNWSSMKSV